MIVALGDTFRREAIAKLLGKLVEPTILATESMKGGSDGRQKFAGVKNRLEKKAQQAVGSLQKLVIHGDLGEDEGDDLQVLPPIVDLSIPGNAFAWFRARCILSEVGTLYDMRLGIYLGIVVVFLLLLDFEVAYQVSQGVQFGQSIDFDFLWVVAATDTVVMLGVLVLLILSGTAQNLTYSKQGEAMSLARVEVLESISKLETALTCRSVCTPRSGAMDQVERSVSAAVVEMCDTRKAWTGQRMLARHLENVASDLLRALDEQKLQRVREGMENTLSVLSTLRASIDARNATRPRKVLGITASIGVVQAIVTAVTTGSSFLIPKSTA